MQTNYEEIEFTKKIRITEEDLDYIRKIKGKSSMARKLQEIINKHRYGNARLRSEKGMETAN